MNLPWILRITTIATMLAVAMIWLSPPAAARGGISHPDIASAQHIEELPSEIRSAVRRWQSVCGAPLAARHSFAHYLGDKAVGYRLVALHFNELDCTNRAALCTSRGCLHQVYMSTDGVYRLVFSANVSDITLRFLDHTPAIEIDCERFGPQDCPRVLRWNGRRFAGQPEDQPSRAQLKAIEATRLVTDTRRAYFDVVVATNLASVRERSKLSANARAELAKKIGGIGALNKPDQTRGRTSYADDVPFAQVFLAQRERLTVLAGQTISSAKAPTAVASARELSDQ